MDIDRYLADNEPSWARLDRLSRAAAQRASKLDDDDLEDLLALHARVSADLSHARLAQPEPALIDRLSMIVGGSRTIIEGRRAVNARSLGTFFTVRFPVAVWQLRRFIAVSFVLLFAPAVGVGAWIANSSDAREASAPEAVRAAYVQEDFEAYYSDRPAEQFATEVTLNNIRVSILAFAGGMLLGIGTVVVLIGNGANLGFAVGLFAAAGEQSRFYGLIAPHGLLELTAVVLAGAAGLSLGWAVVAPGDRRRGEAVTAAAQRCLTVILGLVVAFVAAGLIEGFVTGSTLSTALRVGLGATVELGFLSYLYVFGRRGAAAGAEGHPASETMTPGASGEHTW